MNPFVKGLISGLIIGGAAGAFIGMNWNQMEEKVPKIDKQQIKEKVKESVKKTTEEAKEISKQVIKDTKEKLHKATEPTE